MRLVSWVRFTWNLKNLPENPPALPENYALRRAVKQEEKTVLKVIHNSLGLDSDWLDVSQQLFQNIENCVKVAFAQKDIPCIVLCHGTRIVGASVLTFESDPVSHLTSGPCILIEYRNRGFGSALLYESLQVLKSASLHHVYGITKKTCPSAKFVYPKFNGTGVDFELNTKLSS